MSPDVFGHNKNQHPQHVDTPNSSRSVSNCVVALRNATAIAMFSPDAAVPASVAARNPRRRQRTGSDDSVALRHNPKRIRRSGLTSETFQPPNNVKQNGHIENVEEEPIANGHAKEPGSQRHASVDATSLAIRHRGVKKADRVRRTSKNDGSIELASRRPPRTVSSKALTFSENRPGMRITP